MPNILEEIEELIGKINPPLLMSFFVVESSKETLVLELENFLVTRDINFNIYLEEPIVCKNHNYRGHYMNLKSKKKNSIEIYIHAMSDIPKREDVIQFLRENPDNCLEAASSIIAYINNRVEIIKSRIGTTKQFNSN